MALMQFSNNAATLLDSSITNVATSLTVTAGQGALFPNPTAGQYFYMTIADSGGNYEIVKCTARSTDTFTITRGQDGTTGAAWNAGVKVELRLVRADLDNFGQLDSANTWASGQVFVAPVLGTPASGNLANCTFPTLNQNTSGTAAGLSSTLAVTSGGTGLTTLTANNVILGNGTSNPTFVAPSTSGNVLTSNGTTWASTALPGSYTTLGTLTTTSGATQTLSSLTLTSYKYLWFSFNGVSTSGAADLRIAGIKAAASVVAADLNKGFAIIDLTTGVGLSYLGVTTGGALSPYMIATGYTTATTSVSVSVSTGTFDAGSVVVYGVK